MSRITLCVSAVMAALVTCAMSGTVWGQDTPENRVVCSDDPAIYAIQQCEGYAGKFEITNGSNNKVALMGMTSGTGGGVYGKAISGVYGVLGEGNNIGVYGKSALGYAGKFEITSGSNNKVALMGVTSGTGGGVYGKAISGIYGVLGESNNIGVYGKSASGYGVYGTSNSKNAAFFQNSNASNAYSTVFATSNSSGAALHGLNTGTGYAAYLTIGNASNGNAAVYASTNGTGDGVFASTSGSGAAVHGYTSGTGSAAKFEVTNASNSSHVIDVETNGAGDGLYVFQTGTGRGAYLEIDNASSYAPALIARTVNGTGDTMSVVNFGTGRAAVFNAANASSSSPAVYTYSSGTGAAIMANSYSTGRAGEFRVYGWTDATALYTYTNGSGYAFHAVGDAYINGTLTKTAGSFKIDHPLDPENKYLYHSFVESPDMKNVYDGIAFLDANGEAWVELPEWFDSLNKDFRYQLTAIGAPGPNLYVAEEIAGNEFKIAGGQPGMKVSWQVTGIRQDAYANAHRIPVEENKPPAERGTYLSPESFGQPVSRGADWKEHSPEAQRLLLGK